jgi:hypothetical protein
VDLITGRQLLTRGPQGRPWLFGAAHLPPPSLRRRS